MKVSNLLHSLLNTESDEKDGSCHDEGSKLAPFSMLTLNQMRKTDRVTECSFKLALVSSD